LANLPLEDYREEMGMLDGVNDGDRVHIVFSRPIKDSEHGAFSELGGTLRRIVGRTYISADGLRKPWGMPPIIEITDAQIASLDIMDTLEERSARRRQGARGELLFAEPPANDAWFDRIEAIAEMWWIETSRGNARRAGEIALQMDDAADAVSLAKTKRRYMLERARLGRDFHPWTDPDPSIFRI